jgi:hypothetical protein
MKRLILLLLFFVTCSVASYGQITFSSLTEVAAADIDTSAQIVLVNPTSNIPVWRGSVGELLKAISRVGEVIATGSIIDGTITDADIASGADIGIEKLDTTSADGVVSKSRLANALDDVGSGSGNASGRALQTITADGTDTLDFGGTSYATDYWQIDLNAVTTSTINFTNPNTSIVPTYNLHFLGVDTDTIIFASTLLDANQDTISSHVFTQGQIVPVYYAAPNYYTNYLTLSTSAADASSSGGGTLTLNHSSNLVMAFVRDSLITEDVNGISNWGDFSGNNRDMVQSVDAEKPSTDVSGNIVFDGVNDGLIIDTTWWDSVEDSAMTVIVAFEVLSNPGSRQEIYMMSSDETPSSGFGSRLFHDSLTTTTSTLTYISRDSDGSLDEKIDSFYTITTDSSYLFSALASETTTTEVRINGSQVGSKTNTSPWDANTTDHWKGLAAYIYQGTRVQFSNIKIKFFAVWNKKLSASEIETEEALINSYLSLY